MQNNVTPIEEPDFPYPTQNSNRKVKLSVFIGVLLITMMVAGVFLLKQQPKKTEVKKVMAAAIEYK